MVVGIARAIHRSTMWASVGTAAAAEEATSHAGLAGSAGKAVEPVFPRLRIWKM